MKRAYLVCLSYCYLHHLSAQQIFSISTTIEEDHLLGTIFYFIGSNYPIYVLSALGLGYLFYRYQINRRRIRSEQLQLKNWYKTKNRAYAKIASAFSLPLSEIIDMTAQMEEEVPHSARKNMELIRYKGKRLKSLVDKMINLSNLEPDAVSPGRTPEEIITLFESLEKNPNTIAGRTSVPFHVLDQSELDFIQKVRATVQKHMQEFDFSVAKLAGKLHYSKPQFYRKVKGITGLSPGKFIRAEKIRYAQQSLEDPSISITTIAFNTGFKDPEYFSRVFKQETGQSPSEYRKQQISDNW